MQPVCWCILLETPSVSCLPGTLLEEDGTISVTRKLTVKALIKMIILIGLELWHFLCVMSNDFKTGLNKS